MCQTFRHGDEEYLDWLGDHPNGYVFNGFPGERVFHRATCTHLRREADTGRRTAYPKVCCTTQECILERIRGEYGEAGDVWRYCRAVGAGCW